MKTLLLLVMAVLTSSIGIAQDLRSVEVTVTAIAGADVFLDRGSDDGLAAGDTLTAIRDGRDLGNLIVNSVASRTATVGFAAQPFALTRGDRLTITWRSGGDPPDDAVPEEELPPPRVSVFDQPADATIQRTAVDALRLSGRIQLGTSAFLGSADRGGGSHGSATPFAGIRARVDGLPLGLYATVNGYASHRMRSGAPFERPNDVRLYQANVGGNFGALEVEAGRLRDPYDRFTGFTDGLRLHLGDAERGFGLTAGFDPDWAAGAFSTDLPRLTATGHSRVTLGDAVGEVVVLAGVVQPRLDGLVSRPFAGTRASAGNSQWHFSLDALVDRDPATGEPAFSRLLARGRVAIAPSLDLRVHASRRRPYLLMGQLQVLRPASDRFGAGFEYGIPMTGGTRIRGDASYSTAAEQPGVVTISSGLTVSRLPLVGLGIRANASVWMRDGATGVFATGGLHRTIGDAWISVAYRISSAQQPTRTLVTHGVETILQLPIADRVSWTVQAGADFSEQLLSGRAYTGLWIRL